MGLYRLSGIRFEVVFHQRVPRAFEVSSVARFTFLSHFAFPSEGAAFSCFWGHRPVGFTVSEAPFPLGDCSDAAR